MIIPTSAPSRVRNSFGSLAGFYLKSLEDLFRVFILSIGPIGRHRGDVVFHLKKVGRLGNGGNNLT
jgi:hypothetical protein